MLMVVVNIVMSYKKWSQMPLQPLLKIIFFLFWIMALVLNGGCGILKSCNVSCMFYSNMEITQSKHYIITDSHQWLTLNQSALQRSLNMSQRTVPTVEKVPWWRNGASVPSYMFMIGKFIKSDTYD